MRRFMILSVASVAVISRLAGAQVTYIGNGEMPDFPQVWPQVLMTDPVQKNKAICEAAASADMLWYWDQHGYAGLVPHADATKPNDTWRADGKDLVYTMGKYIYGKDPLTGAPSNLGAGSTYRALGNYIRTKGMYAGGAKGAQGLVVDQMQGARATYTNWVNGINSGGINVVAAEWRGPNGQIALHAMTSAGVDPTNKTIIVVHGWGDHPGNLPPFKKPPYAAGEEPYINEYPITITGGKASIPNDGLGTVELFNGAKYGAADQMQFGSFFYVHPGAKAKVEIKPKKGLGFDTTYTGHVSNDTFAPVFQYIQEVETPVSNVVAPPGWTAVPWSYLNTPDVTRLPFESAQPPFENDPLEPIDPVTQMGILWYTQSNPILPGANLDGFAFDSSDAYGLQAADSMSFISDGRSTFVDASTTGLTTELLFPTLLSEVPEPGSMMLLGLGLTLLLRRPRE